jgi:hypothetical protein
MFYCRRIKNMMLLVPNMFHPDQSPLREAFLIRYFTRSPPPANQGQKTSDDLLAATYINPIHGSILSAWNLMRLADLKW